MKMAICDTIGGSEGKPKCHQLSHGEEGFGKNVTIQFLSVILLKKVNSSLCQVTHGGGGMKNDTKYHKGRGVGESKKS